MYDPPAYLWALTFIEALSIPALTCVVLYRGTLAAGLGRRRAGLLTGAAALVLGGWFAASAVIAAVGAYHTQLGKGVPWLGVTPVLSVLALLATARIPAVASALSAPGMTGRLMLPHATRVGGLVFLITMALGHLPAVFAVPAGLGDMAVGISAPRIARRLARGDHRGALRFHALGTTDLVVALGLGGLTGYQILHVTPVNDAISTIPLALIPTVGVPLLLALHIISIRQLLSARTSTPATGPKRARPVTLPLSGLLARERIAALRAEAENRHRWLTATRAARGVRKGPADDE